MVVDRMNGSLSQNDAARLAKLLGMLGSHHHGERASAALKANEFVRDHGLTWRDVIVPTQTEGQAPDEEAAAAEEGGEEAAVDDETEKAREAAKFCLDWLDALREWEQRFIEDVIGFEKLSTKQIAVIWRTFQKCKRHAREATNDKK